MPRSRPSCIVCSSQIQQLHTALNCEECNRWQHLRCGTGISQSFYWKVAKCLGVFEWSCSACSTSTQSEGNETSQISLQPKRRCSRLDGDGHPTIPPKRRPAAPVSSRSIAPGPSQSTALVPSRSTAPVHSRSTAQVNSRPTAPVSNQSTAPVSVRSAAAHRKPVLQVSPIPTHQPKIKHVFSSDCESDIDIPTQQPCDMAFLCQPFSDSDSDDDFSTIDLSKMPVKEVITYDIVEKASARGQPLLVSNCYSFISKSKNNAKTKRWRCRVQVCSAAITQNGDTFVPNDFEHCHLPEPYLKLTLEMIVEAKEKAEANISEPARAIATEIFSKVPKQAFNIPGVSYLTRVVNNTRQRLRRKRANGQ